MDNFHEEVVKKKDMRMNNIVYYLSYFFMLVFGFIVLNLLFSIMARFNFPVLIVLIISVGITYGLYVLKNNQRIEYEYTFTNGDLDIAKVIMNSKRKHILSTNIKEFEAIAPVDSDAYRRIEHNKSSYKVYNVFNNTDRLYYGLFNHNGTKSLLIFEPSDKLLQLLKVYNPRIVQVE